MVWAVCVLQSWKIGFQYLLDTYMEAHATVWHQAPETIGYTSASTQQMYVYTECLGVHFTELYGNRPGVHC